MNLFTELKRRNVFRVGMAYGFLAWLVLQVTDVLVDAMNLPPVLMRMVFAIALVGLIPVLVFAWIYEMTPAGLRRESEISPAESTKAHTARKLNIAIIVLIIAASGLFAVDRFLFSDSSPEAAVVAESAGATNATAASDAKPSIAVLPFVNMSGNVDNEYFSDGLTETLLHMLAQVDDLRVAARTSAFAFKGRNMDVREIARQLGVSTVLEGSVQRSGDRVRITAQLIDAGDANHIWSESFDRELDDIFAIQDEIANAVVDALSESLLGHSSTDAVRSVPNVESLSTRNPEAYDRYLQGLSPLAEDSYGSLPLAEQAFRDALLIDPDFREARITLVRTYIEMAQTGLIETEEMLTQAQATLAPLVESDPDDPETLAFATWLDHTAAWEQSFQEPEFSQRGFEKIATAIARAPNEPVLYELAAQVLGFIPDQEEEQLAFLNRGLEVDPLSLSLLERKAAILGFGLDRYEDALAVVSRIREVEPANPMGYSFAATINKRIGNHAEAIGWAAASARVDPRDHEIVAQLAIDLLELGLVDEAEPYIERAMLLDADGAVTQSARLRYLDATGQTDEALVLAESILRAQRTNRRGVYAAAAIYYIVRMDQLDRTDEAMALFERLLPGSTTDPGFDPDDTFEVQLVRRAQAVLVESWDDAQKARWREVSEPVFDLYFPDWRSNANFAAWRYQFDIDDLDTVAQQLAAKIREPSNGYDFYDRLSLAYESRSALREHPLVQAAIAEAEAHRASEREKVLAMMADGEIAQM